MNVLIDSFERRFAAIHSRSHGLLRLMSDEDLFQRPRDLPRTMSMFSCGEYLLRSAATVEQTFGGITTRLWDDPFEWTLPEKLNTTELVAEYLDEVDATRIKGMKFFGSDDDLMKNLPAPETLRPIFDLLTETIAKAEHFQGRAFALFQVLSDDKLPRM